MDTQQDDTSQDGDQTHTPTGINDRVPNESTVTDGTKKSTKRSCTKERDGSSNVKKNFHLEHSPVRFQEAIGQLSEAQQKAVNDIGFGGLLAIPKMSIRKIMVGEIAKNYQVSNQTFRICDEDVPIYLEDVRDILGLQIEGNDVDEYLRIKSREISEGKTLETPLFQRFADASNNLELGKLECMIRDKTTLDEDFKRAFVLFTIGVFLASTTVSNINFRYIHVVEDVSLIRTFNWGKFTLNNLLDSCHSYIRNKESTLKGNLALLQCWYWERVIVQDRLVKYNHDVRPRMVMWDDKNGSARVAVFNKKGINGGNLMLSCHTNHHKNEPPIASTSQGRQSKYADDQYMTNAPEEGLSKQQMQSLEEWKTDTESSLGLRLKRMSNEMDYKFSDTLISQSQEYLNFKKEIRLEVSKVPRLEEEIAKMKAEISKVPGLEAENAKMKAEIKELQELLEIIIQPTPTAAHVQAPIPKSAYDQPPMPAYRNAQPSSMTTSPHLKESPCGRFSTAYDRINAEAPNQRNDTKENIMQQQGRPSTNVSPGNPIVSNASTHIKPRQTIIDNDYYVTQIDREAAVFVVSCYEHATVVHIDNHVLTAGQLRRNVNRGYMVDSVINAYVHLCNVETESASFITTFDANFLKDKNLGDQEERLSLKERVAKKCERRHMVFVPMHINKNHWALLVLNFIKEEVQILNSLPHTRDTEQEKALVQGVQTCIEYSVHKDLVNFVKPINLIDWERVPYDNIPRQDDGHTCGAYLIKYILAWDGDRMAHDFTSKQMQNFKFKICTRLLRSERNLEQLPSNGKPITKEDHYAKYPDEPTETDELQVLSSPVGKEEAQTASETEKPKRGRGRPPNPKDEGNPESGGSANPTGALSRKRGRPKQIVAKPTPTVADELSSEALAKRHKRQTHPGKLVKSPYKTDY